MDKRLDQLEGWVKQIRGVDNYRLEPASADASFRRYFRFIDAGGSCVVMDAPPEKEDIAPYVRVARDLNTAGLHAPVVEQADLAQGFLLLSDLGDKTYLAALSPEMDMAKADRLYSDAIDALLVLQCNYPSADTLPPYDRELLMAEMELFRQWYLGEHLGFHLTDAEQSTLDHAWELLCNNALEQPQVAVHRDYHSRNLMVSDPNPGILDFQDAVYGPLSYDLVSLLRDCYITWPMNAQQKWIRHYYRQAIAAGLCENNEEQFLRWFDLMGVQRHLKASGIFARLNHRDGKPAYLNDIPRTLAYVVEVCKRYPELTALLTFLIERVGMSE